MVPQKRIAKKKKKTFEALIDNFFSLIFSNFFCSPSLSVRQAEIKVRKIGNFPLRKENRKLTDFLGIVDEGYIPLCYNNDIGVYKKVSFKEKKKTFSDMSFFLYKVLYNFKCQCYITKLNIISLMMNL